MRSVSERSVYILDPHTAVGVISAARVPLGAERRLGATICLACAHPVKFLPAVAEALHVDEEAALRLTPDLTSHKCVAAVGRMSLTATRVSAAEAVGQPVPPGCAAVFRRGDDWEAKLRAILEGVTAGRTPRTPPRPRL